MRVIIEHLQVFQRGRGMSIASNICLQARKKAPVALALAILLGSSAAYAADGAAAPSDNATVNLIRLLVKQHVISQASAEALLKEAESEAAQARSSASAPVAAAPTVPASQLAPPPAGTVRVPYVPEIVRNQIRDQVKDAVVAQARAENWAQPNALPGWLKRFEFFGDFRFRDQNNFFSNANEDGFGLIDFQNFNANGPTDVNLSAPVLYIPYLNVTESRNNILSYRMRLGVKAHINDDVFVGIRLASGDDGSPVSTTQTLGGGLAKDNVWLDQAYIDMKFWDDFGVTAGRMPDPFVHTSLLFDENLNFDGIAGRFDLHSEPRNGLDVFANAGFFPLGYISDAFPTNDPSKHSDRARYLAALQAGVKWTEPSFTWVTSAAFYNFVGLQGQLSAPCDVTTAKQCSTDQTRPLFMQKGNTLFFLRDIIPPAGSPTDYSQPQYVGLALNYREAEINSTFTWKLGEKYDLQLQADYVRNVAYDPKVPFRYGALGQPIVNAVINTSGMIVPNKLDSGPNGYQVQAQIGDLAVHERWQWNFLAGYRYLEPDAVLDSYTWHDFHLGGTNAKGYFLAGTLGVYENTAVTARWLSADQVFGPRLSIDVLQVELNTSF
jgi:hypothetical protein